MSIDLEYVENNGRGVIYYMKDEWGNEAPYDFKNIKFYREEFDDYFFTFSFFNEDYSIEDLTLKQTVKGVYNNIIKPYYLNNKLCLNDNIIVNTYDFDYVGCFNNIFGYNCHDNTLVNCFNNTFGNACYNNTFGNVCYNNTFGNECSNNTFGDNCNNNYFAYSCYSNTFGNVCYNNTFGNGCFNNTFGNNCHDNDFGNNCRTIGFYNSGGYEFISGGGFTYTGEELSDINNIILSNECSSLLFYPIDENNMIQNITVTKGVKCIEGQKLLLIGIPKTDKDCELKVARNSSGDIKIYCEADLIL
jgi:hypothetical protein